MIYKRRKWSTHWVKWMCAWGMIKEKARWSVDEWRYKEFKAQCRSLWEWKGRSVILGGCIGSNGLHYVRIKRVRFRRDLFTWGTWDNGTWDTAGSAYQRVIIVNVIVVVFSQLSSLYSHIHEWFCLCIICIYVCVCVLFWMRIVTVYNYTDFSVASIPTVRMKLRKAKIF